MTSPMEALPLARPPAAAGRAAGPSITSISSANGVVTNPHFGGYSAGKAGILGLTRVLAEGGSRMAAGLLRAGLVRQLAAVDVPSACTRPLMIVRELCGCDPLS